MKRSSKHEKAVNAIQLGNHDLAISLFEKALLSESNNEVLLIDFARFLKCLYRYDDALELLDKVYTSNLNDASIIHTLATISDQCRAPKKALEFLRSVENNPACLYKAAEILERLGDIEGAAEHLIRADQCGGITLSSELLKAQLFLRAGESEKSLELLEPLIKNTPNHLKIKPSMYYTRGKVYDSLGEYSDAYHSWGEAKKLLIPMSHETLVTSNSRLEAYKYCIEQISGLDIELWKEWQDPLEGIQPLMVTGFPRSGTTLLEHCIASDLELASADENKAFGDLVWRTAASCEKSGPILWRSLNKKKLSVARDNSHLNDYQAALASLADVPKGTSWIIDKNPQLLMNIPIILRMLPRMPIIAVSRDPRDVMISCYSQDFGLNSHSVHYLSFENIASNLALVRKSEDKLKKVLGNQMIKANYEKLVEDSQSERTQVARGIQKFAPELSLNVGKHHSDRISYSPTYADVAKPIYKKSVGRWKNYQKWLEPHLEKLTPWL